MLVYKHTETINTLKSSPRFKKKQILWGKNSRILRIKNGEVSGYHFYMNTDICIGAYAYGVYAYGYALMYI